MPGALFLEDDKVNLRTIEEEDLEFLRDNINSPRIRTFLTVRKPQNMSQQKSFYEEVISGEEDVHLAVCDDEDIVGIISLEEDRKDVGVAKIGIWIGKDYQGNGYGTEAAELITDYGFSTLDYHRVMAQAYESNKASQRIWEKLGFTKEGELREQIYRNGNRENAYVYGVLKREWLEE